MEFKLDKKLQQDTIEITNLELSLLLLHKNSYYPWFILVPKKAQLKEIIDLNKNEQIILLNEINYISNKIKMNLKPDKLNIANIGNIVSQLHIHIIARYKNDIAWPNPVWGQKETKNYNISKIEQLKNLFLS